MRGENKLINELRKKFLKCSEYPKELINQSVNEKLEILHYNFDTEKNEFFNAGKNH